MNKLVMTSEQRRAYGIGLVVTMVGLVALVLPLSSKWHQPGTDNVGHDIECVACHIPAPGTTRQQLQANARFLVGMRDTPVWFSRQPVSNTQCLDCHENENDLHPVYRFNEPRFAKAREAIAPQYCVSCHQQHQGNRVSMAYEACALCHEKTEIPEDPIDVSHAELTRDSRWGTCFGCHDFHGNHVDDTPTKMADLHPRSEVEGYFAGGLSPYGMRRMTVMQTMKVKQE